MCFISSGGSTSTTIADTDTVERHQADASITKTSQVNADNKSYLQNTRTTPMGLGENVNTQKKTLLGE